MGTLKTISGEIMTPAFLPDATRAVVRSVDAFDLEQAGVQAVMVNALHLGSRPGASVVSHAGGVHAFMGWRGPVASDSGGFQVYSLAMGSGSRGGVTDRGFTYRPARGREKKLLTPEKSIARQLELQADILFCLDQFTDPRADADARRESVERTVAWAARCKAEFERGLTRIGYDPADGIDSRPALLAVVQGGEDAELRRRCASELAEIGFDGYAYGGWPVRGGKLSESVGLVAELVPKGALRFALGIGKPEEVAECVGMGYDLFDCVLPTRDARHKRLYVAVDGFAGLGRPSAAGGGGASGTSGSAPSRTVRLGSPKSEGAAGRGFYRHLYMHDERHRRDSRPLDESCGCPCCGRYSRAYLHHLFEVGDASALRLATLHNLRFYTRMMERLRGGPGAR